MIMLKRWIAIILFPVIICGCRSAKPADESSAFEIPSAHDDPFKWTIGSQCDLVNYSAVKIEGYSLVWGLQGTGSSDCPPQVRDYLIQYLNRIKPQKYLERYSGMTSEEILNDKSTAVVMVRGVVPAGAPKGESFDVTITALPTTQTTSLQGGYLALSDLRTVGPGSSGRILASHPYATAEGPLFINPFPRADGAANDPRRAVIFGGGKSISDRRIELALKTPDFRMAQLIQKAINNRFPPKSKWKTADGTRDSIVISVPEEYRQKYQRFVAIIMALYLYDRPGDTDIVLGRLDEKFQDASADMEAIALAWEAIGKTALPYLQKYYTDLNSERAYYAARTALRLEDKSAIDILIPIANNDGHPCQVRAVKDLGEYPLDVKAHAALIELLNRENAMVRIEAYDTLRKVKDPEVTIIRTVRNFTIDRVATKAKPFVCIWAAGDARVVLFGDIACSENIFSEFENGLITLNAPAGAQKITLIQQAGPDRPRFVIECDRSLYDLVVALSFPRPSALYKGPPGLHMTFSEVAGLLYQLNQQKIIDVPFHLQRFYEDAY